MARGVHKLSDALAKSGNLKAGRHSDGGGLYLNVSPTGSKSWVFMWSRQGKQREMGLGPYPVTGLARARKLATDVRSTIAEGRDPIAERALPMEAEPTFGDASDKLVASMESSWRNDKHRAQWRMTLEVYAGPIREKRVSAIDTNDILQVLTPIWSEKPETASRLRGRMERVLDFAKAKGWRSGENPAMWRGHLKNVLPARSKLTRKHHEAMPYEDLPAFMVRVRGADAMAARSLELTILAAARSGEAREAVWSEFDLDRAVWVIPAARMKAGKEHRVPLSAAAISLLRRLHEVREGELVFPGQKQGRPLSNMAMEMFMRRLKVDFTVHGFRSAFRDWAGNETSFSRELAEHALAHRVGDETERAYRRSDALERRRALMDAWAAFLAGPAKK